MTNSSLSVGTSLRSSNVYNLRRNCIKNNEIGKNARKERLLKPPPGKLLPKRHNAKPQLTRLLLRREQLKRGKQLREPLRPRE
jgi:hypothetical protein